MDPNVAVQSVRDPRGAKGRRTRHRIHIATARLVGQQGMAATTVEQICRSAAVSERTFFNYFGSKRAAAFGFAAVPFEADVVAVFNAADGSLTDAICELLASTPPFTGSDAAVDLVRARPELLSDLGSAILEARTVLTSIVAARIGDDTTADAASRLVLAAVALVMTDLRPDTAVAEQFKRGVAQLVRAGDTRL